MGEYVLGKAGVFVREMIFENAGDSIIGHAHNFDHVTYVAKGAMRIEVLEDHPDGDQVEVQGSNGEVERRKMRVSWVAEKSADDGQNFVLIEAGKLHRITALRDSTLGHCIYAHRNAQGNVQTQYSGFRRPYV
jgi:hypothetical protein